MKFNWLILPYLLATLHYTSCQMISPNQNASEIATTTTIAVTDQNVIASNVANVTAKATDSKDMHRITKPIVLAIYDAEVANSTKTVTKLTSSTSIKNTPPYKMPTPMLKKDVSNFKMPTPTLKDSVFKMSGASENFVPSPQLDNIYEHNPVPVLPAHSEAKIKAPPMTHPMSIKPLRSEMTQEEMAALNQKRSPMESPPDWFNKVKFPTAPPSPEFTSPASQLHTRPHGFNFGEVQTTVGTSAAGAGPPPCENALQVSLNSPCVVNADLPRQEDFAGLPPPGIDGKLENIDGKFGGNPDGVGLPGYKPHPTAVGTVVAVPYHGGGHGAFGGGFGGGGGGFGSGGGGGNRFYPSGGGHQPLPHHPPPHHPPPHHPPPHQHPLHHHRPPIDHLPNYGIGVAQPKKPPYSFDSKSNVMPWKKIVKFLTTILPIGLLLSALTPSIITIGPAPNMTYGPQPTYIRGRSADESQTAGTSTSLASWLANGCEEKIVCQLLLNNVNSNQDAEALLQSFTKYERTSIVDNEDLKKLFEAVKQKNCSLLECGSTKKRVKDINLQKLAKT